MLERLYKRTATGAVQVWDIEVDAKNGRYRTISGQLHGKATTSEWTVAMPKNLGRANATTSSQQAELEAKAEWDKKQRKGGYSLTVEAAQTSERFQCMLATKYEDKNRRKAADRAMEWGDLYEQPKLDGARCLVSAQGMLSRQGTPIVSCSHIQKLLAPIFEAYPLAIIDGELFNYEMREDFEGLMSLVRQQAPTEEEQREIADKVQLHTYDCFRLGFPDDAPFSVRIHALQEELVGWTEPVVQVVPTTLVKSQEELDARYAAHLERGDEGQMLRIDAPYENKRSAHLMKRKEYEDDEFKVIDILEGVGNRAGQAGRVVIEDKKRAVQSEAGIKGPKLWRVKLLEQKSTYIGGEVTIRFNGRTGKNGVPRFARALADKWWPQGRKL
jgi:DNA ligase-1